MFLLCFLAQMSRTRADATQVRPLIGDMCVCRFMFMYVYVYVYVCMSMCDVCHVMCDVSMYLFVLLLIIYFSVVICIVFIYY